MKRVFIFAWISLSMLALSGCQTSPYSDFNKVEIGTEKGRVLSLLGNPDHRYRKSDTDRWAYRFQDGENAPPVEKEIWFQNGRVVYRDMAGKAAKPPAEPKAADYEELR